MKVGAGENKKGEKKKGRINEMKGEKGRQVERCAKVGTGEESKEEGRNKRRDKTEGSGKERRKVKRERM